MDIPAFWNAVLRQDADAMRPFFHPDANIRWHCTNECFTLEEYLKANCAYAGYDTKIGDWDGSIERIESMGDLTITVTRVYPKDRSCSFHVTSFFQIENDRIRTLDEYWADDAEPPQWRKEMHIGTQIS